MSIFLSGGPILEPLIGIICATVSCIMLLIFCIIKFLRSKKYKSIKTRSTTDQLMDFLPLILLLGVALFVLWWILAFLFAGIAFEILKSK